MGGVAGRRKTLVLAVFRFPHVRRGQPLAPHRTCAVPLAGTTRRCASPEAVSGSAASPHNELSRAAWPDGNPARQSRDHPTALLGFIPSQCYSCPRVSLKRRYRPDEPTCRYPGRPHPTDFGRAIGRNASIPDILHTLKGMRCTVDPGRSEPASGLWPRGQAVPCTRMLGPGAAGTALGFASLRSSDIYARMRPAAGSTLRGPPTSRQPLPVPFRSWALMAMP